MNEKKIKHIILAFKILRYAMHVPLLIGVLLYLFVNNKPEFTTISLLIFICVVLLSILLFKNIEETNKLKLEYITLKNEVNENGK
jgi:predicted membrane channel-forming protein YqfA (hemolysin III family)